MRLFKEIKDPADRCILLVLSYIWFCVMVGMVLSFLKGTRMGIDAIIEMAFPFP